MPQLDFFTFSNQHIYTLTSLFFLYYYNVVIFFPKLWASQFLTENVKKTHLADLYSSFLWFKETSTLLFLVQIHLRNTFFAKISVSSFLKNQLVLVNFMNLNSYILNFKFFFIKIFIIFIIIIFTAFFFLKPMAEFLILWFFIKLFSFCFVIFKIISLILIKIELAINYITLKLNEVSFVLSMKLFTKNIFVQKIFLVNNLKNIIKKNKITLNLIFETLTILNLIKNYDLSTRFIIFDEWDLNENGKSTFFDDLKPFLWHMMIFFILFYIVPFLFGCFFVYKGNIFFQNGVSCQMESIEALYNYVMIYLTVILFFITTILFFIISCGIDGNHYFEFLEEILNDKNNNSKLQKKLIIKWYILLFQSMKKWNHSTTLELIWTIVPTIILILIAGPSFILLYSLDEIIDSQCTVKIIAHQWYWEYEYPIIFNDPITDLQHCTNVSYLSFMVPSDLPIDLNKSKESIYSFQEELNYIKHIPSTFLWTQILDLLILENNIGLDEFKWIILRLYDNILIYEYIEDQNAIEAAAPIEKLIEDYNLVIEKPIISPESFKIPIELIAFSAEKYVKLNQLFYLIKGNYVNNQIFESFTLNLKFLSLVYILSLYDTFDIFEPEQISILLLYVSDMFYYLNTKDVSLLFEANNQAAPYSLFEVLQLMSHEDRYSISKLFALSLDSNNFKAIFLIFLEKLKFEYYVHMLEGIDISNTKTLVRMFKIFLCATEFFELLDNCFLSSNGLEKILENIDVKETLNILPQNFTIENEAALLNNTFNFFYSLYERKNIIEFFTEEFKINFLHNLFNVPIDPSFEDLEKIILLLKNANDFFEYLNTKDFYDTFVPPKPPRLLAVDTPLVLPHSTNVWLIVTSQDVLHSFAIPALGLKIDAVSGRLNQISLYAYGPGIFYGQCSELCGIKHGFMPIEVFLIDKITFENFLLLLLVEKTIIVSLVNELYEDVVISQIIEGLLDSPSVKEELSIMKLFNSDSPILCEDEKCKSEIYYFLKNFYSTNELYETWPCLSLLNDKSILEQNITNTFETTIENDSKIASDDDSKTTIENDSKIASDDDSKTTIENDSKIASDDDDDSKVINEDDFEIANDDNSEIANDDDDSKITSDDDSKITSDDDSKIISDDDSKITNDSDLKIISEKNLTTNTIETTLTEISTPTSDTILAENSATNLATTSSANISSEIFETISKEISTPTSDQNLTENITSTESVNTTLVPPKETLIEKFIVNLNSKSFILTESQLDEIMNEYYEIFNWI